MVHDVVRLARCLEEGDELGRLLEACPRCGCLVWLWLWLWLWLFGVPVWCDECRPSSNARLEPNVVAVLLVDGVLRHSLQHGPTLTVLRTRFGSYSHSYTIQPQPRQTATRDTAPHHER